MSPTRAGARYAVTASMTGVAVLAALTGCSSSSNAAADADGGGSPSADTRTVSVTLTPDTCEPAQDHYPAGPLTFKISNKNATAVSELELLSDQRIIGEKENLPPGFSGSFSLKVDAGTYTLYCPGATDDRAQLTVTGTTTTTSAPTSTKKALVKGTKQYGAYINQQAAALVTGVQKLDDAITSGNIDAARTAYAQTRAYYEHVEPVAESFTIGKKNLDAAIDARAGDVPASQWKGFHRIEKGLFAADSLKGLAPYSAELLANVKKLAKLTKGLTYQPAELANGAVALLDEVARTKITGEEERYSHIDLLDFQANVEGSQQAFANLEPGLREIDPGLTKSISTAFRELNDKLTHYRASSNPSGFVYYGQLTDKDTTALAHSLQAVAEPLSRVAGKVVRR
ncbi:MAG: iron uptake system protein EfeO [Nocardioidaceae bacterium]